jgi:hypothetical protein
MGNINNMMTRTEKLIVYAIAGGALSMLVEEKLKNKNKEKLTEEKSEQIFLQTEEKADKTEKSSKSFKQAYSEADPETKQKLILKYTPDVTPNDLHPVTVNIGNGYRLTMQVLKAPKKIGTGTDTVIPNPSPSTLQALAKKWDMILPTGKMLKFIEKKVDKAEQKGKGKRIKVSPLSSSGYIDPTTGKSYTPEEVAKYHISDTRAGLAYTQKIMEEMQKNPDGLYYNDSKHIIQPLDDGNDKISFVGAWQPEAKAHAGAVKTHYTEYEITIDKLVKDQAVITKPDGSKVAISLKAMINNPKMFSLVSDRQGYKEYDTSKI